MKRTRKPLLLTLAAVLLLSACFAVLPASASGEPGLLGDLTNDGQINATDYMLLKRAVLGTFKLDEARRQNADVSQDGQINATDYMLLKRAVLGTFKLTGGGQSAPAKTDAEEVLRLVNENRASDGKEALTLSDKLCELALLKAQDMILNDYFDHVSPTYGSPSDMLERFGVSYTIVGENIAYGYRSPADVMDGWMNSPGHRANILDARFTELGVAKAVDPHGRYYWVQIFRHP